MLTGTGCGSGGRGRPRWEVGCLPGLKSVSYLKKTHCPIITGHLRGQDSFFRLWLGTLLLFSEATHVTPRLSVQLFKTRHMFSFYPLKQKLKMLDALRVDILRGEKKKVCYFSNPLWTRNIITAVNSSGKRRNEWTSLFYYYYFWHGEPHACLRGADRRSLPRWQCCYNLLYNKHIFQAFQPGSTSLWAGTSAKQRITSHRLTHTATSHVVRTGASQYRLIYCLLGFYGIP